MVTPVIVIEDVEAAVREVTAMDLPDLANQAVCVNETWSNRADGFPKAFGESLKGLGVDNAVIPKLVKQFQAALPDASRARKRREEEAAKAAKEAVEEANREKEAIRLVAEGSKLHRNEIKRLYQEANEAVEDLSDDGINAPKRVKDLLDEAKNLSDGTQTAWEKVRDAVDKALAEQEAKDLEETFNEATDKFGKIMDWVNRQKSVDQIVEKVRQSRRRTQELLNSATRKARTAQEAFVEADALEKPQSPIAALLRRPVSTDPVKAALRGVNQDLEDILTAVSQADTDAANALSGAEAALGARPNRKSARAALKDALAAEEGAETGESKVEAAAAAVTDAAARWKKETEKKVILLDQLLSLWWVRAVLVTVLFLLVLIVLPNPYKVVLGLAVIPVAILAVFPPTWKARLGQVVLGLYAGAVALLIGIIIVVPLINGAPEGVSGSLPGAHAPTKEPTVGPTPTSVTVNVNVIVTNPEPAVTPTPTP